MSTIFEDKPNKVIVNPKDVNKVIVQEQITHVEIGVGGPQGVQGEKGETGAAATVEVGTTTTGSPNTLASVTNSGNSTAAVFNFTIPRGVTGTAGEKGRYTISESPPADPQAGDTWFNSSTSKMYIRYDNFWVETSTSYAGPATNLSIGGVTTGQAGTAASVSIVGSAPNQSLYFTIPRGSTGIPGTNGYGVPTGGSAGQILTKIDSVNYNTTWSDLQNIYSPTAVRWSPTFQATGLTFTGTNSTYPTYNSYYVKIGQLVTFNIKIQMTTVTNFGTGQFKVDLPFIPIASAANHFSAWAWVDPSQPADELNGHVQMVADHISGSQTLDLHWLKETTASPKPLIESLLTQGTPVTFTTASIFYVNGTYISAS